MLAGAVALVAGIACASTERTTINVDGSSTVFPITQRVAEDFRDVEGNSRIQIPISVSGTGGGFQRFSVGETDISNASRPIRAEERAAAAANGVEFIELTVAFDGIAIVTHPDNSAIACLTTDELHALWRPERVDDIRWNQIRPEFPDEAVVAFGPDRNSGTFDYFTEAINDEEGVSTSDYSASADDNVLVVGVSGENHTLGYFGYAYYAENTELLRLIAVDSGDGCITPNEATIGDGSYTPLSRPLFIYVNVESLERPEVREFVEFYLDNAGRVASEVDYVPLSATDYATERAELDAAGQ